jgi:SAM-dependent methyltransferase
MPTPLRSRLTRRIPGLVPAADLLLKRALTGLLWALWRSNLHQFYDVRGTNDTPGRHYIDAFLARYAGQCRGAFLEFGDPRYRTRFAPQAIEHYDVFDIDAGPQVTIVGDLQHCPHVPSDSYDVIVCTQVLEHVPNPFLAAAELGRILKPGGLLLLTVPAAYPYHSAPNDYWRFSRDSLQLLFRDHLRELTLETVGNRLTIMGSYWNWYAPHFPQAVLEHHDAHQPYLVLLAGRK